MMTTTKKFPVSQFNSNLENIKSERSPGSCKLSAAAAAVGVCSSLAFLARPVRLPPPATRCLVAKSKDLISLKNGTYSILIDIVIKKSYVYCKKNLSHKAI